MATRTGKHEKDVPEPSTAETCKGQLVSGTQRETPTHKIDFRRRGSLPSVFCHRLRRRRRRRRRRLRRRSTPVVAVVAVVSCRRLHHRRRRRRSRLRRRSTPVVAVVAVVVILVSLQGKTANCRTYQKRRGCARPVAEAPLGRSRPRPKPRAASCGRSPAWPRPQSRRANNCATKALASKDAIPHLEAEADAAKDEAEPYVRALTARTERSHRWPSRRYPSCRSGSRQRYRAR